MVAAPDMHRASLLQLLCLAERAHKQAQQQDSLAGNKQHNAFIKSCIWSHVQLVTHQILAPGSSCTTVNVTASSNCYALLGLTGVFGLVLLTDFYAIHNTSSIYIAAQP
jgi:hypothetical protein